jgi:hypothetical protein
VPGFSLIQDNRFYFNHHHTAADKIVPRELAENAAINAVFAYALASLEQPLPRQAPKIFSSASAPFR